MLKAKFVVSSAALESDKQVLKAGMALSTLQFASLGLKQISVKMWCIREVVKMLTIDTNKMV